MKETLEKFMGFILREQKVKIQIRETLFCAPLLQLLSVN